MAEFDFKLVKSYLEKDELTQEDIKNIKKLFYLEGDFSLVEEFFIKIGLLDSITVNLLNKSANENQIKMMLSGSMPLNYNQQILLVFFILKSYRNLVKELFIFLKSTDISFKRKLVSDVLFQERFLIYLVKLLKNDNDFVKELIASKKYDENIIDILTDSEEPEVLFKISNITNILKTNIKLIDKLLKNPFTPDESIIQLKQLLVDIKEEVFEKKQVDESDKDEETRETHEIKESKTLEKKKSETDDNTKDLAILEKEESEIDEEIENNLFAKILTMKMPEKMKLAMKGNKSARMLLLKDPNKQISLAALNNPRITDSEISFILKNKATGEHLIREIARDRTWMKDYNICKDLVSHPKTPMEISSRLLNRLYLNDLGKLAKSKDIPANLRTMAARMFEVKNKRK